MKETDFLSAFGEINEAYIETAAATVGNAGTASPRFKRKMTVLLIAAAVCLCLMGAAAVGVMYGDSIQSWFSHEWALITKRGMSQGQLAVIDHLSQDINISKTVDGVTVTVDSATVGDDTFYLLLRAEGVKFSSRYYYGFRDFRMELSPDPREERGTFGGDGFQYVGRDGDGAALFLMSFNYAGGGDAERDTSPLQVTLTLKDLFRDAAREKTIQKGEWVFTFTVDRSQPLEAVALPDIRVELTDRNTHEKIPVWLRDIRVTSVGIRFRQDSASGTFFYADGLRVILKNGAEVGRASGFGTPLENTEAIEYSYQWQFPVDLDEAAYICIGDTRLPLP